MYYHVSAGYAILSSRGHELYEQIIKGTIINNTNSYLPKLIESSEVIQDKEKG